MNSLEILREGAPGRDALSGKCDLLKWRILFKPLLSAIAMLPSGAGQPHGAMAEYGIQVGQAHQELVTSPQSVFSGPSVVFLTDIACLIEPESWPRTEAAQRASSVMQAYCNEQGLSSMLEVLWPLYPETPELSVRLDPAAFDCLEYPYRMLAGVETPVSDDRLLGVVMPALEVAFHEYCQELWPHVATKMADEVQRVETLVSSKELADRIQTAAKYLELQPGTNAVTVLVAEESPHLAFSFTRPYNGEFVVVVQSGLTEGEFLEVLVHEWLHREIERSGFTCLTPELDSLGSSFNVESYSIGIWEHALILLDSHLEHAFIFASAQLATEDLRAGGQESLTERVLLSDLGGITSWQVDLTRELIALAEGVLVGKIVDRDASGYLRGCAEALASRILRTRKR